MSGSVDQSASYPAAQALYRALARIVLAWNFDPEAATHNPVFVHDGAFNYVGMGSTERGAHEFLRNTGVLQEGLNGAYRLPVPLDQLDSWADTVFEQGGVATEELVQQIIGFLEYERGGFGTNYESYPEFVVDSHPIAPSFEYPDGIAETKKVLKSLQTLGFVRGEPSVDSPNRYRWTAAALPVLKRLSMVVPNTEPPE